MGTARSRLLAAFLGLILVLGGSQSPIRASTNYAVVDIGDFTNGEPTAINSNGDVVGYKLVGGHWHALLYRQGILTDLGTFGASDALAMDVNDAGLIALILNTPTGLRNALWDGNTITDITSAVGYSRMALNAAGELAGTNGSYLPFVYSGGVVHTLPSGGCSTGNAFDLNANGVVVGRMSSGACGGDTPAAWQNGVYQRLTAPPGVTSYGAYRVNGLGLIGGNATSLVRWTPDGQGGYTSEDLGLLPGTGSCVVNGINESGVMTGDCDSRAFVWDSANGLRDLNDTAALPAGAVLESGHDMNNSGVIVARGIVNGHFEGYVLTPSSANQAPVAVPGPNQTVRAGLTVQLSGAGSYDDNTAPNQLAYAWTLTSAPNGSTAILVNANTMTPSFTADLPGDFTVQLVVTDQGGLSSAPSFMTIGENPPPVANAGLDQLVIVNHAVNLVGSATDADGDPLTYEWSFAAKPNSSGTQFASPNQQTTTFVPDVAGTYVARLTPSDFLGPGTADEVQVTATTASGYAAVQAQATAAIVVSFPSTVVTTGGNQNAFVQFLANANSALDTENLTAARQQLQQAISRTDGCALRGGPDGNGVSRDWVTSCTAQNQIYPLLTAALAAIAP